ncbi:MAG: AraC family transcriptional regulator, partial [Duncaniella sp.]|nr:AraC family transcriptional regulator [Duncaniella sp.]
SCIRDRYMEVMAADTDHASATPDVAEPEAGGCGATPLVPSQSPEDAMFLDRVRRYIEANIANSDANVEEMAEAAAVSRSTLNRRLRSNLGISAAQLMIEARMKYACQLLGDGTHRSLAETAGMCGYSDPQYFQRVFRKRFGVAPGEYSALR